LVEGLAAAEIQYHSKWQFRSASAHSLMPGNI
jgi:hypothetical protein